jgi:two-component system, LytTR family, sensor kinase
MLPDQFLSHHIPNKWLRCNIQYTLIGLLIGTFVSLVFALIANYNMTWRDYVFAYFVSVVITLCISNISILSDELIRKSFSSPLAKTFIFYLFTFVGIVIGTEISIAGIALLYDVPFGEIDHLKNLSRNLTIGMLAGTVIYIYKLQSGSYTRKIQVQELEMAKLREMNAHTQLLALQSSINPHFLYNALNSITSLIHDAPEKAEEMTIKLSQLFRFSISNRDSAWSTVEDELEMVNIYLDIERVRFGNRIAFTASADEQIKQELIPRFVIQPLVENALKHGLRNTGSGGVLSVQVRDEGNNMVIEVHDNGEPFPADMLAGYGVQSIHDKVSLLYGDNGSVNFVNSPRKMAEIRLPKQPRK